MKYASHWTNTTFVRTYEVSQLDKLIKVENIIVVTGGGVDIFILVKLLVQHTMALESIFLTITGEGNGNPFQYSCLENPKDTGAWWATVYGVANSQTRLKRLSAWILSVWTVLCMRHADQLQSKHIHEYNYNNTKHQEIVFSIFRDINQSSKLFFLVCVICQAFQAREQIILYTTPFKNELQ